MAASRLAGADQRSSRGENWPEWYHRRALADQRRRGSWFALALALACLVQSLPSRAIFESRRRRYAAALARRQRRALPREARPAHAGPRTDRANRPRGSQHAAASHVQPSPRHISVPVTAAASSAPRRGRGRFVTLGAATGSHGFGASGKDGAYRLVNRAIARSSRSLGLSNSHP